MKNKTKRAVSQVVIATGISAVVAQLLIIREFLTRFMGNEFVISLILFNWLFLGAAGALFARFVNKYFRTATIYWLAWLSVFMACLPTLQILGIRLLYDLFFVHGSSTGFYSTLAYTSLIMAPHCLLIGFILPYSLFAIRAETPGYSGANIYIMDNIGDIIGGALFSFVLVYLLTPLQAVFVANLPLLAAVYFLFPSGRRNHFTILSGLGLAFVIILSGMFLESFSLAPLQGKLAYYCESRYGRIEVHQDGEQFTLFEDGVPKFSSRNLIAAEETIHYPLSQVPEPQHILLISAQGGIIKELNKYHPETIDYVELNPEVTRVLFRFGMIKKIPGLNVIHQDGRAFVKNRDKIYDAVIINLPEPETFQINRFFTGRFFSLAKNRLAPHGVLSFSMQGFDNYLAEPQRAKLSSLYSTVSDHFRHVLLLPGEKIFFLCSDSPIKTDIPGLLFQKNIRTAYISSYYYGNITDERIRQLNDLMDPDAPKNLDYFPRLMRIMFLQWFSKYSTSPLAFTAFLIAGCLVYLLFFISREEYVLFSTGCITMGSEVLIIFVFQIFFGYIYLKIGIVITLFLAGLLPGAILGRQFHGSGKGLLVFADSLLIVLLSLFILAIQFVGDNLPTTFFLVFGFMISLACGFEFPVALHLRGDDNRAMTRIFSADLIGAAAGILIVSLALIPYFGIIPAAAGLIGIKLTSLIVITIPHNKNEKNNETTFSLL